MFNLAAVGLGRRLPTASFPTKTRLPPQNVQLPDAASFQRTRGHEQIDACLGDKGVNSFTTINGFTSLSRTRRPTRPFSSLSRPWDERRAENLSRRGAGQDHKDLREHVNEAVAVRVRAPRDSGIGSRAALALREIAERYRRLSVSNLQTSWTPTGSGRS